MLLIVFSLVILSLYLLLAETTYRSTVLHPTELQYIQLQHEYPNSVLCPCTSLSTSYSTLITIQPRYHQLCFSDFVSSEWINFIYADTSNAPHTQDYRWQAVLHFHFFTTFCQQAQQTIGDALRVFLQTHYVSAQVVPPGLFRSQVNAKIEDWELITISRFLHTNNLIRATTGGNQIWANTPNTLTYIIRDSGKVSTLPRMIGNCSCALFAQCRADLDLNLGGLFFATEELPILIPNFFVGCYTVEALLASQLQCFYNQSCIDTIVQRMGHGQSSNFSALNKRDNWPYETVESIVNRLMVDSWSSNISFSSHYNSCAPISCTFEYRRRYDLFLIITTIIGLFGGLSLGLQLIILCVLRLIEKFIIGFSCIGLRHFITCIFRCGNELQMTRRLHFVLVLMTIYVLYTFSAFRPQLLTVELAMPSLSVYWSLTARFSDSVYCPCSQISIEYRSFLNITPRFHEICSSDLVSEEWITFLYNQGNLNNVYAPSDFRHSASSQFRLLASLCQLSQGTVSTSLSQLFTSNLMNTQLFSSDSFDEWIRTTVDQFQMTTPNLFLNALSLIRETTGANMLMTRLSTSWEFINPVIRNVEGATYTMPVIYDDCSCSVSSKCVQSSRGMLAGCYPLEALLKTTLQCLYNQTCIDQTNTFKALGIASLSSSRFTLNSTIEALVQRLMVEEYSHNISYEKYFAQCAPPTCSYSYIDRSNLIEGIATLISLYSGLVIIDRVIAVIIVKLFQRLSRRVSPQTDEGG